MSLGKSVRLSRIFSHTSGHLFGAAVDHFVGYGNVREGGLADLPTALEHVMSAGPDSVTIQPGSARHLWSAYAGNAALIIQGGCFTADDRIHELIASPEDAVRLGADALAVAIPLGGSREGKYIKWLTDSVRDSHRFGMPVVAHIYPRDFSGKEPRIVFTPEGIAYAVRIGIETGVDVIKVGYPDDFDAFKEIVEFCPVPVVMAGGPKTEDLEGALAYTADALKAGAVGAVVGRNLWGHGNPTQSATAFKHVIHDGYEAKAAIAAIKS